MKLDHFLMVNRHRIGYGKVWPFGSRYLDDNEVEDLLPQVEDSAVASGIAYSATRLPGGRYALVVGLHWPHLREEKGRSGLYFWHGLLCHSRGGQRRESEELSALFLGIVRRYDSQIDAIGDILQSVATGPMEEDWAMQLCRSAVGGLPPLEKATSELVLAARRGWSGTSEPVNLRIPFPFHEWLAVPCLVDYLTRHESAMSVGGGRLILLGSRRYSAISRNEEVPGFRSVEFSEDVLASSIPDNARNPPGSGVAEFDLPGHGADPNRRFWRNGLPILVGFLLAILVGILSYFGILLYKAICVKDYGLGAILSVNHALFREDEIGDMLVEFTLVNDTEEVVEPTILNSWLIINKHTYKMDSILAGGDPRATQVTKLPPMKDIRFECRLGSYCGEPGLYHVSWQGRDYASPEIVFRVRRNSGDPSAQGRR